MDHRYEFHSNSHLLSCKNSIKAEKLVSKSQFPENASNNEWARYLYYTGRIKAIQLEYSDAQKTITTGTFYQFRSPYNNTFHFQHFVKLLKYLRLDSGRQPQSF